MNRRHVLSAAVALAVAPFAAVKGEYRTWRRASSIPRNHGGFFQVCFTF